MALDEFLSFIDRVEAFDAEAEQLAIIENNGERLVELQQEQLAAGIDNSGQARTDEYAPLTVHLKQKYGVGLGAVTDRVTFFSAGTLYKSLKPEITAQGFQINSPLDTFDIMTERIGDENYGLSPDQCFEFAEEIMLPQMSEVIQNKIIG